MAPKSADGVWGWHNIAALMRFQVGHGLDWKASRSRATMSQLFPKEAVPQPTWDGETERLRELQEPLRPPSNTTVLV
ncbi:hypothetical protein ACLBYG_19480 [Methylobacterium sp. D53M]